jgi:YD repeat-containing protein
VTSRTFPETDQEVFVYDGSDNVTSLTQVAKTGSGLANTVVSATYEPTWNHLASITDALNHTTTFAYYASGNGASLMRTATRPSLGAVSPVYTFTYNAIGLPTQSVDPAGVTTGHGYDSYGHRGRGRGNGSRVGNHALGIAGPVGNGGPEPDDDVHPRHLGQRDGGHRPAEPRQQPDL